MAPSIIERHLGQVGRLLNRWQAQIRVAVWSAAALGCLWACSVFDLYFQLRKPGRLSAWLAVVALLGLAVHRTVRALKQHRTPQGVAATIERSFPQLDNHLINYIQFSVADGKDPFKEAYVRQDIAGWQSINVREMWNRRTAVRAYSALGVASLCLLLPLAFSGPRWSVAVWRILNPFATIQPISLTHILNIEPGDTSARKGDPLVLSCTVRGRAGHEVWLDVQPSDDKKATYAIGRIKAEGDEEFSYRLPKLTTDLRYRFRAGDAPFPAWHTIKAREPLAFTSIRLEAQPPDYTRAATRSFDAISETIELRQGSTMEISAQCNLPLTSMAVVVADKAIPLRHAAGTPAWKGRLIMRGGSRVTLTAQDIYQGKVDSVLNYTLIPDRAPAVQIESPKTPSMLPPGAPPVIRFSADDDYGLTEVAIERVELGSDKDAPGKPVQRWTFAATNRAAIAWTGVGQITRAGQPIAYRVVARDNCGGGAQASRSPVVLFNAADAGKTAEKKGSLESEAASLLGKMIDLQRENIEDTKRFQASAAATTADQWNGTAGKQKTIRQMAATLLQNPLKPLGGLTPTVEKLYVNEMPEAVERLQGIPTEEAARKTNAIARALSVEERILRQLGRAEAAGTQNAVKRRVSELMGLLENLIKGEVRVIDLTKDFAAKSAPVGPTLVDQQDDLAVDVTEFVKACRIEADAVVANDKSFAELSRKVAAQCESQKVREDMLLASEQLQQNKPAPALPHENQALAKLKALQQELNKWQSAEAKEQLQEMMEALETAQQRLEKIRELQAKAIECMDMVKAQKDAGTKKEDMMEEEYAELTALTKDALLEIPVDLQIFQELNVANELVEDVFSVFEEVVQEEGSEKTEAKDVKVLATAKREELLEMMESTKERIDAIEKWLGNAPDALKVVDEAFDQEEMPEAGMALGALPTEAEDIISDLLKNEEAPDADSEDGAINQAVNDLQDGKEITEGDIASFAAKGKSGNETPDHKEQDGRSNVGRQGMSVGETAAGSGTINEGDKNIEARRTQEPTQSGQVDLDGKADTKATGGGKLATGKADEFGMGGGAKRMDSTEAGSEEGVQQLMAARTQALYVKASLLNLRTDSLQSAAHHMWQAADAVARGYPIQQVKEQRRQALAAMKKARTELTAGTIDVLEQRVAVSPLDDSMAANTDQAPAQYRDLVAEYYKSLSESM